MQYKNQKFAKFFHRMKKMVTYCIGDTVACTENTQLLKGEILSRDSNEKNFFNVKVIFGNSWKIAL